MRAADGAADAPPTGDAAAVAAPAATADAAVQFLPLRSRVGKRFQATLPALQTAAKRRVTHAPTPQFLPERAEGAPSHALVSPLSLTRNVRNRSMYMSYLCVCAYSNHCH